MVIPPYCRLAGGGSDNDHTPPLPRKRRVKAMVALSLPPSGCGGISASQEERVEAMAMLNLVGCVNHSQGIHHSKWQKALSSTSQEDKD